MPYIPNTADEQAEMFKKIGISSIDELFASVPSQDRFKGLLNLPAGLTEMELTQLVSRLESQVQPAAQNISFLGCGSYEHFIPAVVDALASDPRFVTAYTPYQAEASQGSLQTFFEYQTLIAGLTGMDLSNASHYDGATACAEAVLMAQSAVKRHKVVVPDTLHPEYRQVLAAYLANLPAEIITVPSSNGVIDLEKLSSMLDKETACVVVQNPNFFGNIESVKTVAELTHKNGSLLIECFDPVSLGILARPADLGADIAVAEGQPLGIPMSFGGPYLGILACKESLMRRMPGRLVGQTTDRNGKTCWVLTMQTREQHIRREKATSNICSNQGLMAVRACIYLAALGPYGLKEAAELCLRKAHYLASELTAKTNLRLAFPNTSFFKEFTVRVSGTSAAEFAAGLENEKINGRKIFAGVPLSKFELPHSGYADDLLNIAVTEKRTREELDLFVKTIFTKTC